MEEKLNVSPKILETLSYYYFAMGLISLFLFIFSIITLRSFYFFSLLIIYLIHTLFSFYLSRIIHEKIREYFIFSRKINYFLSSLISILFFLYFLYIIGPEFINSLIILNYFLSFLAIIWYIFHKYGIFNRFLKVYSFMEINAKKKEIADKIGNYEIKEIVKKYKPGNYSIDIEFLRGNYKHAVLKILLYEISRIKKLKYTSKLKFRDRELYEFYEKRERELKKLFVMFDRIANI